MAVDKLVDSAQLESDLTSIADAIRAKTGGTADLQFPADFVSEIGSISGGYSIDDVAVRNISGDIVITTTDIAQYAFAGSKITSVSAPNVVTLNGRPDIFLGCKQLASINFPNWEKASNSGRIFEGCTALTVVHLPKIYDTGDYLFNACTGLTTVVFSVAGRTEDNYRVFNNCQYLAVFDQTSPRGFNANCFNNCARLKTIVLRSTTIPALRNLNVFNGSPFASGKSGGTIYIPKVLYDELGTGSSLDYKAATNWSTIDGYGTITWAQIEGSIYETEYADGTPVPTE